AAAPAITNACIVCTGASAAATPELVARRTADILRRLSTQQTQFLDSYRKHAARARLSMFTGDGGGSTIIRCEVSTEPLQEAEWIARYIQTEHKPIFVLHGALTEELSRALLVKLSKESLHEQRGELIVEDATKIFCRSVVLQRLFEAGLEVYVANPIKIIALSVNPYTPDYFCSSQHLLDALAKELSISCPPIVDVISGYSYGVTQ
ncbi:MAG TPA: hypothetical protein VE843_11075, partial [Ktedonobacteraceae bacterium]|nr:hypothetical protein [Ktedonobacteraceae bacterium]